MICESLQIFLAAKAFRDVYVCVCVCVGGGPKRKEKEKEKGEKQGEVKAV